VDASFTLGALELATDVEPADWVVSGVRDFRYDVGSLLPAGFAAYARVFHPALLREDGLAEEVRWSRVAAANGFRAHAGMEWVAITGGWRYLRGDTQPGLWDEPPRQGSLPVRQAGLLAARLAAFTGALDRCWFAVWEGFGGLALPRAAVPRVRMPQRDMLLLSGPLSAVTTSLSEPPWDQLASLWWPADRAWCVATDVDLMTTYVAGSRECVDALLADPALETGPVTPDQRTTWDCDHLNPVPPAP
jgi:hypothetical protein